MHSNTTYAVYWTGPDELIPSSYSGLIDGFLGNVAADSGRNQNVYSLTAQYTDGTGSAAYDSTFGGSFEDADPLPTEGCESKATDFCVSDGQIRNELDSFITDHGLPRGLSNLYFVFLPEGYGSCFDASHCAYTYFCAYHSHFGSGGGTTLYANQPWDDFVPNGGGSPVCGSQPSPNGDPAADHEISTISHEHNEAITDPLGNAWFDAGGNENGDKCAYEFGPGLDESEFDEYNQAISTGRYEIQLEWSNAAGGCRARAGGADLPPVAAFSPSASPHVNVATTFDASASSDPDGTVTSFQWEFGDGTKGTGESPSHTYTSSGAKTVTLTVTDNSGSKDRTSETIHVQGVGCQANEFPANDDESTEAIALPFTLNFFGQLHSSAFVNNNGNVTFDTPLSTYTPFDLTSTSTEIIAPFFADVDTRAPGSDLTTYGDTTYGGRAAFCVSWGDARGVGYYEEREDKLNKFQLLLVDRSDVHAGDFDIVMSYGQIQWETGDASEGIGGLGGFSARMGYSNGTGDPGTSFELPGSAVNGAFLDSNLDTGLIHNSRGSLTPGRYVFEVRNGEAPSGGSIQGTVTRAGGGAVAAAPVQACPKGGGACITSHTSNSGFYAIAGLEEGDWVVTASPPAGDLASLPASVTTHLLADEHKSGVDVVLGAAAAPPPDTEITSIGTWADGEPVLYWQEPLTLTTHGCPGGSAHYSIVLDGSQIRAGSMAEVAGSPGLYEVVIPPLYPNHGYVQFHVTITCPNAKESESDTWSAYIDPSGVVVTPGGDPISGATVTLYRSDSETGPFDAVADGAASMSPENRRNPDTTDEDGHFGWDVVAGYYRVRAEKEGCHAPGQPDEPFAESSVLSVPPAVTDLELVLACPPSAALTPERIDFGSVPTGARSDSRAIRVADTGPTALHVLSATLEGAGSADFHVDSNGCGQAVPPQGVCEMLVSFQPGSPGSHDAELRLADDSDAGSHLVSLHGVGEAAGPQPAGRCDGLSGRALRKCKREAKLARRLAACNRKHGRQRSLCRRRALAMARCEAKSGRAQGKCIAEAKAIGGGRRRRP